MIIKSMSRKVPSFSQLIQYMEKEAGQRIYSHNLIGNYRNLEFSDIVSQFEKNADILPKRKNGNYLYHEVISFGNKNELDQEKITKIFQDIGRKYLEERAPNQLAFCVEHFDTHQPHIHLCISSNALYSEKRERLSKAQFLKIQKNLEYYILETYPELDQKPIYTKTKNSEKIKSTNKEQEYKKRSQKLTKKEQLKTQLHGLFEQAQSKEQLVELLEKENLQLYTRGKTTGIIYTKNNRKYRLKTLGLFPHYKVTQNRLLENESIKKGSITPDTSKKGSENIKVNAEKIQEKREKQEQNPQEKEQKETPIFEKVVPKKSPDIQPSKQRRPIKRVENRKKVSFSQKIQSGISHIFGKRKTKKEAVPRKKDTKQNTKKPKSKSSFKSRKNNTQKKPRYSGKVADKYRKRRNSKTQEKLDDLDRLSKNKRKDKSR